MAFSRIVGNTGGKSQEYRGTRGSISRLQRSIPPAMLWQAPTPCWRSQWTTFKLRTP